MRPGFVAQFATIAGRACTMRKSATPARMTMMDAAAPVERPKKMRSAGRDFALTDLALPPRGAPGRSGFLLTFVVWPFESLSLDFDTTAGVSLTSFFLELAARGRPDGGWNLSTT